jgi:hypothetical protein
MQLSSRGSLAVLVLLLLGHFTSAAAAAAAAAAASSAPAIGVTLRDTAAARSGSVRREAYVGTELLLRQITEECVRK